MTGKDVVNIAFDLKEPPRIPTTLIAGGALALCKIKIVGAPSTYPYFR